MKIAIACQSLVLQRALELFLAQHLATHEECDLVILDTMGTNENALNVFWITSDERSDLRVPFSQEQLLHALHTKIARLQSDPFERLQARLIALTTQYQTNLLKILQEFHEQH